MTVERTDARPLPSTSRGSNRTTIREVASEAGVSVTTVSRVLSDSGLVRGETRDAVLAAVEKLNYVVNTHARALAGGTSRTVAFLVKDMVGPSFAQLASGVETEAADQNHLFVMSTTHDKYRREEELVDLMREQRVAAVLLVGAVNAEPGYEKRLARFAEDLHAVGSRLVLCGRPPLLSRPDVLSVEYDNFGGGYSVTRHLIELGHRRILFVTATTQGNTTGLPRLNGYRAALAASDLPIFEELIVEGNEFTAKSGYEAVQRALEAGTRFTAVVAVTDVVAIGALRALREAHINVPEQVSLTGFDDDPFVSDLTPALTTVKIPFHEVGQVTTRLALDQSGQSGFKHVVLPVEVVVRQSTGPAPDDRGGTEDAN